jgi:hypothetical protein
MKIRKELKFASFEYDDEDKSIEIVTRSESTPDKNRVFNPTAGECCDGACNGHIETDEEYAERVAKLDPPVNGRIYLNKTYSFALLRFVIRIAQRNWYRKWSRPKKSDD